MSPVEPAVTLRTKHPLKSRVLAARPPFLLASVVPVLLGLSTAAHNAVPIHWLMACVTLIAAVLLHAAVNLFNDYYDALSGCDASNTSRVFPFTGGSRFIQNRVFSAQEIAVLGMAALLLVLLCGIVLLWQLPAAARPGLGLLGVTGVLIGWAYSAPPLVLNSRGLGELSVTLGFMLLVVGSDYVQRQSWSALPFLAGLPYALLVTNLLWINQFPDCEADRAVGKCHWVVRLGPDVARAVYAVLVLVAYAGLLGLVLSGILPVLALLALLALPLSVWAAWRLWCNANEPQRLTAAIQATIAAMLLHGVCLSVGLVLA